MHLLDINVLIALSNRTHVHHRRVRSWFLSGDRDAWATCPLTENGFIRIVGHAGFMEFTGGTEEARAALRAITSAPGHQFWADNLSIVDAESFPRLSDSKHLTDLYLLALAVERRGQLATLDERINENFIPGGSKAYFVLPE